MKLSKTLILLFLLPIQALGYAIEPVNPAKDSNQLMLKVYKTPTCGCCGKWVSHLEDQGLSVATHNQDTISALKLELNVPQNMQSCHTAVSLNGYFFEGHIPAKFIKQFIAKPPEGAIGLTVPAMPVGSPGMEMGEQFMPYQVFLVKEGGETEVFAEVKSYKDQF